MTLNLARNGGRIIAIKKTFKDNPACLGRVATDWLQTGYPTGRAVSNRSAGCFVVEQVGARSRYCLYARVGAPDAHRAAMPWNRARDGPLYFYLWSSQTGGLMSDQYDGATTGNFPAGRPPKARHQPWAPSVLSQAATEVPSWFQSRSCRPSFLSSGRRSIACHGMSETDIMLPLLRLRPIQSNPARRLTVG